MKTLREMQEDFLKNNKVKKLDDGGAISVRLNGDFRECAVSVNTGVEYQKCIENDCNNKILKKQLGILKRCYSCVVKRRRQLSVFNNMRNWCELNNRTMDEHNRYYALYKKYKKPMSEISIDENSIKEIEELLKLKENKNIRLKLNYIKKQNNKSITGYKYDF